MPAPAIERCRSFELILVPYLLLLQKFGQNGFITIVIYYFQGSCMASRHRSVRERRMAPSASQPDALRQAKLPTILPHLKKKHKRPQFYDELVFSPDFVRLPTNSDRTDLSRVPESATNLSTSRARSILTSKADTSLADKYSSEDRVVQRYEEDQERYRNLVIRIQRKSQERSKRMHKGDLALIYERLMGML